MTKITEISKIHNAEDLIGYFAGKLGWDIDIDSFDSIDDFSYEFTAEDLGINEESFTKIRSIRQLRPFDAHQKWGLFCIEFDSGKFEVSALRKVLSGLIPRKRKDPNAPVWNQQDILFLCDWGETANRTIGLAHFEEHEKGLPQIKTISCTPSSGFADPKELSTFEERLSGLAWPKDATDVAAWSLGWSSVFTTQYRGTIRKSAELAKALAEVAIGIRDRITKIMAIENQYGYVHLLWEKFRRTLITSMTETDFADMYAQTMVYGLFSARCLDSSAQDFSVEEAIDCIPSTNPFLKNLMHASIGRRDTSNKLSFDELEIDTVVELLKHTDMTEIVKDFGRQSGGGKEDPVLYFYEGFAKEYDAAKKITCGEFYTPVPVVNFIVRAVDDILKKDFGYKDGLATTATKKIKYMRESKRLVNGSRTQVEDEKEVPAVQILDPATGTGTFLRQTILKIHENFLEKHKCTPPDALREAWNVYVANQLLPRLNGFELNMAPYAVAHMKLAMALKDTGYDFRGNERLRVYLTNSLEEPGKAVAQTEFWEDPLAAESIAANAAKKNAGINIVIGNPPYSGISQNNGEWITRLVDEYKYTDGVYFNERKHWLNDDYVKFIRMGQEFAAKSAAGILAYINPHGFVDNITFRAMRWNLLHNFDEIYVVNLHGNARKHEHETCPDGSKDENIFEIEQGVSINIFVKTGKKTCDALGKVYYCDVYGLRESKYSYLESMRLDRVEFVQIPYSAPQYFFVQRNEDFGDAYNKGFMLSELCSVNVMGITSARDFMVVDFDRKELLKRIKHFCDPSFSDSAIRGEFFPGKSEKKYLAGDTRGWKLSEARKAVSGFNHDKVIRPLTYRPFDDRCMYYCPEMVDWDRENVMRHFLRGGNLGICAIRINRDDLCTILVTELMMDKTLLSSKDNANVFPLYLYTENMGKVEKKPNFDPAIYAKICEVVGVKVTPEDVFNYIYAVLHTPEYRTKYKEFLKIDFPRIPYPKDAASFRALAKIGEELVATHLLKSAAVTTAVEKSKIAVVVGNGQDNVEKPVYADNAVWINDDRCFDNVPEVAWNFYIGGYQPAQKWLKDRKGRTLTKEDVAHYRQIIHALLETDRLMKELSELSGTWM